MVYTLMLMLFCTAGEQRSTRAVGNQPRGVSGAEEGRHVWQHVSVTVAHQHRCQSEEELKAVRDSVFTNHHSELPYTSHNPPLQGRDDLTRSHCATWMSIRDWRLSFAERACGNCQTLGFDYFSISSSSWLQSGKVKWPNWLIQPYENNHLWNDL